MSGLSLQKLAGLRIFGKSPVAAYLRLNESIWPHLPLRLSASRPVESYGRFLHSLVLANAPRSMYLGTFFFRNRPELELIAWLANQRSRDADPVRIAVLGCSNGAGAYSLAYSLRSRYPALRFTLRGVDLSEAAIEVASAGCYPRGVAPLVQEPLFEYTQVDEVQLMFEPEGQRLRIKPWVRESIEWHVGDATDPQLARSLGPQDIVVANCFLCHLRPHEAEACLRAIALLVAPGGYLSVSGMDLDVRTRVATALAWKPLSHWIEELHDGDPSLRRSWPVKYWGLEPIDRRRADWQIRYASVFQLP